MGKAHPAKAKVSPRAVQHATVLVQGQSIRFQIRRSRRRGGIGITLDASGVQVMAPKRMSVKLIVELVATKGPWIVQKQAELAQKTRPTKRFVSGERFSYLGQEAVLEVEAPQLHASPQNLQPELFAFDFAKSSPKAKAQVEWVESRLRVSGTAEVRPVLEAWYKLEAQRVIEARVAFHAQRLGWSVPKVLIRDQKTRWGSCNAKGELRFNWRLVQAPLGVLDYVVVHEMAHLKVLNHSPRYWQTVAQMMPDYQRWHQALHDLGASLYW